MKFCLLITILLLVSPGAADARAKQLDDFHWRGVERVIAIGDLHGDYGQYLKVMRSAGLLDKKGRWAGGKTHLVQTGDITDRGPDSRKIIDHLIKLAKQAKKKGGYIHMLIGNHETMNVIGDLRYVHAGEYQAFTSRDSKRYQALQWQRQLDWMEANSAESLTGLELARFREEWEQRVPLGWVEHRLAWSPGGEYGKWVNGNPVAIQINDTIFLHGGISAKYCQFSLQSLTQQVIDALQQRDPATPSIVEDPLGPIWYRGLATEKEAPVFSQTLDNILKRYQVKRIVIGHTPTGGIVWPRFDQRVIVNDTGIAAYYGSHKGVLELTEAGAFAIYADLRLKIPATSAARTDYLQAVVEVDANNGLLKKRLKRMLAPSTDGISDTPQVDANTDTNTDSTAEVAATSTIPGTCQ